MPYLLIIPAVISLILLLWFLAIQCRRGHALTSQISRWSYAHRGLHAEGRPENSMAAFRAALDGGYGIELDVHLLKDGSLAVIHDSKLLRTTGAEGDVEDLTEAELRNYHLEGTDETIPTFRQVVELFAGKAPLVVELKVHKNNVAALCQTTCDLLDQYDILYCLESFDPRCLLWLKKHRPELMRGQLTENYFKSPNVKIPGILRWILKHSLGNFLTRPDFVAYRYRDRHDTLSNRFLLKGTTRVTWTLQTQEEYATATAEGWIPIFEGFRPDP